MIESKPTNTTMAENDPLRSPAWRYERATEIVARPASRLSSKVDDELTRDLVKFMQFRRRVYSSVSSQRQRDILLSQKHPDLWAAYRIFDLDATHMPKLLLESRLLTGQDFLEIGRSMSLRPSAVKLYHDLFFMVQDRLDNLDYIAGWVIGPVFQSGIEEFNRELLMKYFSYFGGPRMLQMMTYGFQSPLHAASDVDFLAFLDGKVADNLRAQALFVTTVMRPGRLDVRTLIEGYTSMIVLQQKVQSADQETDWMGELITTLQKAIPNVRGKEALEFAQNRSSTYSRGEVELRLHEQIAIANGQSTPEIDALETFHRPEQESQLGVQPK